RVREGHPLIERADPDRLPSPTREPGDREPARIGVLVREKEIDRALEAEIERGEPARAAKVELIHASVREAGRAKLPHADPLDVQGEHAALRLIQAADLLVRRGLSDGIVPVDVEDDGDLSLERRRLVEERGDPQAGQRLEAKL